MIQGFAVSPLTLLETSCFVFHPTGSRVFETATSKSDFDFFTQDSHDVLTFLEINDFTVTNTYINIGFVLQKENVQIQLVRDVEARLVVQEILLEQFKGVHVPKKEMKKWWTVALAAYEKGKAWNLR